MQKFREAALGKKSLKTESVPRFSSALSLKCHTSARQKRGQPTEETSNERFGVIWSVKPHWVLAYRAERNPPTPTSFCCLREQNHMPGHYRALLYRAVKWFSSLKKKERKKRNWECWDTYFTKTQDYWSLLMHFQPNMSCYRKRNDSYKCCSVINHPTAASLTSVLTVLPCVALHTAIRCQTDTSVTPLSPDIPVNILVSSASPNIDRHRGGWRDISLALFNLSPCWQHDKATGPKGLQSRRQRLGRKRGTEEGEKTDCFNYASGKKKDLCQFFFYSKFQLPCDATWNVFTKLGGV